MMHSPFNISLDLMPETLLSFFASVFLRNGGRRISYGVGCEKVFPLHAPNVAMIETVRHGQVRRAKLYYLRDRMGKAAKIKERV